jgi:hypothetical protein
VTTVQKPSPGQAHGQFRSGLSMPTAGVVPGVVVSGRPVPRDEQYRVV